MKNYLILPALLLVITSCSKYQINVLSSTNMKKDTLTGKFTAENDSVAITYSFFGRNAPVNLDVYNKLNEPIYIDWTRSALINDGKAISYANDEIRITGDVSGSSVGNKSVSYTNGSIDAVAALPKTIAFVPPHTHANNTLLNASNQFITYLPDSDFVQKEIPSLSITGTSKIKIGEFNLSRSPLLFKSYLGIYTVSNNVPKYIFYQHDFYVSKLINTTEELENFDFFSKGRGDYFYTQKTTNYGKAATGVGVAAALVGMAALNANQK